MPNEYTEFIEALKNLKIAIQNSQELADEALTKATNVNLMKKL